METLTETKVLPRNLSREDLDRCNRAQPLVADRGDGLLQWRHHAIGHGDGHMKFLAFLREPRPEGEACTAHGLRVEPEREHVLFGGHPQHEALSEMGRQCRRQRSPAGRREDHVYPGRASCGENLLELLVW